jgi:hypothetical protein
VESITRRIPVQAGPGIKDLTLKRMTAKRAGAMTQVVECLPNGHKAEFKPQYHHHKKKVQCWQGYGTITIYTEQVKSGNYLMLSANV